jgi:hypothetical protein
MEPEPSSSTPPEQPNPPLLIATNNSTSTDDSSVFSDWGYAASTSPSFLTSLATSVLRGIDENGRLRERAALP